MPYKLGICSDFADAILIIYCVIVLKAKHESTETTEVVSAIRKQYFNEVNFNSF
jgi:hypothetical protein